MIPRVSVLLPLYNCEIYLAQTLDSLSAQTFGDFEVLAINDGSKDGTADILESHAKADPRILPIHTPNGGIVSALNLALSKARGAYGARMDGDDVARSDRFAEQVAFLDAKPECVCVGSLYRFINEDGEIVGSQRPFKHFRQTDLEAFPPHGATPPHPSIMLRTQALREIGGYRALFPHAEDMDMYLRLSQFGRIDVIQMHLLDYRVHSGSISTKNIDIQTDSSLLAVLSAMARAKGLPDPFENSPTVIRSDFYELFNDRKFSRLFEIYRRIRHIESRFNRFELNEGTRMAANMLGELLLYLPINLTDRRYLSLLKAALRLLVRRALGRI